MNITAGINTGFVNMCKILMVVIAFMNVCMLFLFPWLWLTIAHHDNYYMIQWSIVGILFNHIVDIKNNSSAILLFVVLSW